MPLSIMIMLSYFNSAHNRAEAGWSTPPSRRYTRPRPPVLSTNDVYELHISVIYISMDVVNTVAHVLYTFQTTCVMNKADLSPDAHRSRRLSSGIYVRSATHHRAVMRGAGLCAIRLDCVEGHPCEYQC